MVLGNLPSSHCDRLSCCWLLLQSILPYTLVVLLVTTAHTDHHSWISQRLLPVMCLLMIFINPFNIVHILIFSRISCYILLNFFLIPWAGSSVKKINRNNSIMKFNKKKFKKFCLLLWDICDKKFLHLLLEETEIHSCKKARKERNL